MPLNLSAYASDSDDEQPATTAPNASMSHAVSERIPTASTVPAKRKPASRGKLQFHVPAHLDNASEEGDKEHDIAPTSLKRPKLDSTSRPKHSLFNSLPAPTRHALEPEPEREEDLEDSTGPEVGSKDLYDALEEAPDLRQAKSNSAFRQMLGLSPGAQDHKTFTSNRSPQSTLKVQKQDLRSIAPEDRHTSSKSAGHSEQAHTADDVPRSTAEEKFVAIPRQNVSLSAAPDLDADLPEESESAAAEATNSVDDLYEGWQRNPDGTWVPVTPEAIAAYQHHIQIERGAPPTDIEQAQQEDMPTINVNTTLQSLPEQGSEQSAQQRSAHRARHKGQLSSLVNLATERKAELEGKWTRQKSGTASSVRKYGF